jgi:hypothetical protein
MVSETEKRKLEVRGMYGNVRSCEEKSMQEGSRQGRKESDRAPSRILRCGGEEEGAAEGRASPPPRLSWSLRPYLQ